MATESFTSSSAASSPRGSAFSRLAALQGRLVARAQAPVDPASLVAFRIGFGLLLFAAIVRFWARGWIYEYFIQPRLFFPYWGFELVRPWPGWGMYAHFGVMAVAALGIASGLWYRLSASVFALTFTWAHLVDQAHYLNHYYLVTLLSLLLVVLPLGRVSSLDARRNPGAPAAPFPTWALWALRAQVALVYFFGGVAKLKSDWLLSAQPLKLWLSASPDFPVLGALLDQDVVAYAFSWAGAVFDLCIVGFLCLARTRLLAFTVLVLFHGATGLLFNLGLFPWLMTLSALIFFPPSWPRRVAQLVGWPSTEPQPEVHSSAARPRLGAVSLGVGVFLALQVVLPFRYLAYPGNVLWTEQGFRYSWNVMLMEKSGSAELTVRDAVTQRTWRVQPRDELTRYQAKALAASPEMLLFYAHHLAARFRAQGVMKPQVFVEAYASLNGRPSALLVDPRVDLASEHESLAPKTWLMPAPTEPPP
jgi:hypothetical protein